MLYDLPLNYDESGKLQHSLTCKDVVLCLCYQPPGVSYKHPNSGRGVASQAVYVVSGEYIMIPNYKLAPHITEESHPPLIIKEGEIVNLEKYMNISTIDTAGPEGVMMIHINPLSGEAEFNCSIVAPNCNEVITTEDKRTIAFTLSELVHVNDVELSLLNRVRLKKNSQTKIVTEENGMCLILEKRTENEKLDKINADMIKQEELTSKWSKYHRLQFAKQEIYDRLGVKVETTKFIDNTT